MRSHVPDRNFSWRALRTSWALATLLACAGALSSAGCSEDLEGPKPDVVDPAPGQALPVEPGIVCRMQHPADGTPIVVTGENLSPIPYDIPDDPKTALPELKLVRSHALDGGTGDNVEIVYGGEVEQPNNALLSWQSQNQMTFLLKDSLTLSEGVDGMLEPGLYDVQLTNPNANETMSAGALAVVDRPIVDAIAPGITCLEQGPRTITLTGQTVLEIEGEQAVVLIDNEAFPVSALDGCTPIAHQGLTAKYCTTVTLDLADNAVAVGFPAMQIANPETAACTSVHAEDAINLRVVPAPVIESVQPPMVCIAEGDREVVLVGTGFLDIDGALPAVTLDGSAVTVTQIGGNCAPLETLNYTVQTCTELTIVVPQDSALTGEWAPEIVLTNPDPAGCSGTTSTGLLVVPEPTVTSVTPPLICVDDADQQVEVAGDWFLFVDGEAPAVAFDGSTVAADAVTAGANCVALSVEGLNVEKCESVLVNVAQGSVNVGSPTVTVTNPQPAGCSGEATDILTVIAGPTITAAEPPLACTDGISRPITITGTGFLNVDGAWPEVTMDGAAVTVDGVDGCTPVTVAGLTVQECTTLNVTALAGTLIPGDTVVVVTNPAPADCAVSNDIVLTAPPTLTLTSAEPAGVCESSLGVLDVTFHGTGFLRVGADEPTITIAGTVAAATLADCNPLDVDGLTVESCDTFTVTLDTTGMPVGGVMVDIVNPDPSGCSLSTDQVFFIVSPPTVTSIVDAADGDSEVCSDTQVTLTIGGTAFAPSAVVTIGGSTPDSMTFVSETELEVTFDLGFSAGQYDIVVDNGGGCAGTLTNGLIVNPTPLVFFVDPPVAFNGVTTEVTIFTTGLQQGAAAVELIDASGTIIPITGFTSPVRPNRILAPIPAEYPAGSGNPLPPGDYEVQVTSAKACVSSLNGMLTITDTLTLDLLSVDPAFVSSTVDTAVTITLDSSSAVQFASTPRVYLNPNPTAPGASAIALRAVLFEGPTQLTAVVPGGLGAGSYDLIVVNPTSEVGILTGAITVTVAEPPLITALAPGSLDPSPAQSVTVVGEHFDPAGVNLDVSCTNWDPTVTGTRSVSLTVDAADVVLDPNDATSGIALNIALDASGFQSGDVCIVTVTNSDGASFRYSAISIKNPSQNLNAWRAATDMQEGRRDLALVAGRPTNTSRFLYAIGGDDGTMANAKSSVEAVAVDLFGALGGWAMQRNDLTNAYVGGAFVAAPRTGMGFAQIGRFVYLTGGYDGTTAVDATLRAQILNPLDGPEIDDVDAALGDTTTGSGLAEGLYFYRLTATFPDTDANNPGGESLPGDVLPVQLPATSNNEGIILTFKLLDTVGAEGYRLYKAVPDANGAVGPFELLDEITCPVGGCNCATLGCSFVDDARLSTDPAITPLPQGSLGVWHAVSGMNTAREAHATVAVPSPTNADEWFLYAFGGRDDAGAYLSTYEFAKVTIAADGSQIVDPWTLGVDTLTSARADLGAWVVTSADTNAVAPGTMWIYIGPGSIAGGDVSDVEAALTTATGELGTLTSTDGVGGYVGYGAADANGFLFIFGGKNGLPSAGGNSAALCAAGTGGCGVLPDLAPGAWNALGGGAPTMPRVFMGLAQESAFFFLAGGSTNVTTDPASTSVEQTVQ